MGGAVPRSAADCWTATFTAEYRQNCDASTPSGGASYEVAPLTHPLATGHAGTNARRSKRRAAAAAAAATASCSYTRRPSSSPASIPASTSANSSVNRSTSPSPASDSDSCAYGHTRCPSPAASTTLSAHTGGADPRRPADFPTSHNTGSKAATNADSTAARAKARNASLYTGAQDTCTCTRTSRSPHSKAGSDPRQISADPADPVSWPAPGSSREVGRRCEAGRSSTACAAHTTPAASRGPVTTAEYSHSHAAKEVERYPILLAICSSVAQDSPGHNTILCQDRSFYEMGGGLNAIYASPAGCGCH